MGEGHNDLKQWTSLSVWTNAFYGVAGLVGVYLHGLSAWVPALALIFLAYGSGIYHKKRTDFTNKLDWFGMYLVAAAFPVWLGYGNGPWWLISVIMAGFLSFTLFKNHDRQFIYIFFINVPLAVFIGYLATIPLALSILIIFSLAIYSRLVVEPKYDFEVEDYMHGVWHILTSIGFGLMFLI